MYKSSHLLTENSSCWLVKKTIVTNNGLYILEFSSGRRNEFIDFVTGSVVHINIYSENLKLTRLGGTSNLDGLRKVKRLK